MDLLVLKALNQHAAVDAALEHCGVAQLKQQLGITGLLIKILLNSF